MSKFGTCPDCGASLDPGERCDCREEQKMANEKRLIDANEALRMIKDSQEDNPFFGVRGQGEIWRGAHDNAIDCVNTCPTIEAVEVVRCKDCEHYKPNWLPGLQKYDNYGVCKRNDFLAEEYRMRVETDFCSYGERREAK